jgi:murein DD-endopeptidase MepM/ murein hydrolase activator NlpD
VSLDLKIPTLAIGTPSPDASTSSRGSSDPRQGTASSTEGQRLARVAAEFESMLLLQMLREMRKSGSWADEDEDKAGFGAETLFETIDVELASYITKAQGFGLEKSLAKQVGNPAGGVNAVPLHLPSLELPVTAGSEDPAPGTNVDTAVRGRGSSDPPSVDLLADRVETSPFGWRRDPFSGAATYHRGVDLRAAYGEPIGAADAGTVVFAGEQRGYGQTVVVEHAGGVRTRYAHLSSLTTAVGAEVKAGESIGRAGRSGRATGTHLHFEVTRNGQPIDPHSFVAAGLKAERLSADWEAGTGPTLPGVPSESRGSGAE